MTNTVTDEWLLLVRCVLSDVGGSEKSQLWFVLGGSEKNRRGNLNVRQAMLQQVFRVTIFCINTCFQSFSTLICRVVHHAVLKFSPRRNKPQPSIRPYQIINTRDPPVACPRLNTRAMQVIGSTKQH